MRAVWASRREVEDAVREVETSGEPPGPKDAESPPPKILMLVSGGAVVESMMGFLTSGMERKHLDIQLVGGGDAILLESPVLHRVVGDGSEAAPERVRPDSELWGAALCRNRWKVARHIRGDGAGAQLGALPKTVEESNAELGASIRKAVEKPKFIEPPSKEGPDVFSETRSAFRSYAGEPMIFSHSEFSRLCVRAGRAELPLEPEFCQKVKPLVYGFQFKSPASSKRESKLNSKSEHGWVLARKLDAFVAGAADPRCLD
eukprot:CAMPEP_0181512156 /NCGR_PEP_ID=MMETSP1110-20121109/61821_1 /TAXON_ID=174948 /ORGANISM="Symbiodinium sp., Strain CCMP421" /LENGTH=259 /DNA_ID=CAMNT_0023641949 /DNA_START=127 /DNA_END=904 /DNA_ORIENTATION=+